MVEVFIFSIPIIFIVLVVSILLLLVVSGGKRLDIEKNKTPVYTQTSGGRIGWVRYRGPFIRLSIYDEFIVIRYSWKSIFLRYDEIERVEIGKWMGILNDSVQIIHHRPGTPSFIRLGASSPERVKEVIESKLAATGKTGVEFNSIA